MQQQDTQKPRLGVADSLSLFPCEPITAFSPGAMRALVPARDQSETTGHLTMAAKVAAFLKARPHVWHDGRVFMDIAGSFGWRTRLSDCRRAPYFMTIENRQRRKNGFTVSEYRYVPPQPEGERERAA